MGPEMKAPPKYKGLLIPHRAFLRHQLEPNRDTFKFFAPEKKKAPTLEEVDSFLQASSTDVDSFNASSSGEVSVKPVIQMIAPPVMEFGPGGEEVQSSRT